MNNYSIQKFHLLLTGLFFVALFVPACGRSQAENEPDISQPAFSEIIVQTEDAPIPTITPTLTQTPTDIPTSTPIPTSTITPTATPTDILPQLLEKDTSDLFAIPVFSFLYPSGWDFYLKNPPEEYYLEMQPILFFVSPDENSWLTFEITSISDLGNDPKQALQTYSDLRIDYLQNSFPEIEVINQQDSLTFSAEGTSQSHQLEWTDQGSNIEGFALMGLDPSGSYGYMFEGVQPIGDQNLRNLVMLPWTSFFPLAVTGDSLYNPFNEKFDDHGFTFRYPFDSQVSISDIEESSDKESNSSNGRLIIQPPWDDASNPTYLSWITQESKPDEKAFDQLIF